MKRSSPRRSTRLSNRNSSSPAHLATPPTLAPRTPKSKSSKSSVYFDELTSEEVTEDSMTDIMTDNNGCHHCRICNHTFNTRSSQHWIPQWISHKQSKRHTTNRSELLKKMSKNNGRISIPRPRNFHSDSESESDSSYHSLSDNGNETDENDSFHSKSDSDTHSDLANNQNRKKRLKLTLKKSTKNCQKKSKGKNRYKVNCPYCHTSHLVQIPLVKFQLKDCICINDACAKQYWIHFKDTQPIITKQYPFSTSSTHKKLRLTLSRKRQRNRALHSDSDSLRSISTSQSKSESEIKSDTDFVTDHTTDTDSDIQIISPPKKKMKIIPKLAKLKSIENKGQYLDETGNAYQIPNEDTTRVIHTAKIVSETANNVSYQRPYNNAMSHIEMFDGCARSLCSDFVSGNAHCWEAVPLVLPGKVRMASIGYVFECVWCSKTVSFVENHKKESSNSNTNTALESHINEAALYNKWCHTQSMPAQVRDGPSYSRVPFSLNDLQIRDRIMASDGTNWLPAWIEKVKSGNSNKVLVHFKGWNSRWDKWYNVDGGMLKTINEYRKEKKLHSATRNEGIYGVMRDKYPAFVSSEVREYGSESESVVTGEIVMMHDKNEIYMSVMELPIYGKGRVVVCPPLFYASAVRSTKAFDASDMDCVVGIVRQCFEGCEGVLADGDIALVYRECDCQIEDVLFTLYCLKTKERVFMYLRQLKSIINDNSSND